MRKLLAIAILCFCSLAHADFVSTLTAATVSGQTTMPLGDSITFGVGSTNSNAYRLQLYTDLTGASQTVTFVGSLTSGSDLPAPEQKNEGHSGFKCLDLDASVASWIGAQAGMTRLVLLCGTNDANQWASVALQPFSANYAKLLSDIHAACPGCIVYASSIPPLDSTTTSGLYIATAKVNAEIKSRCLRAQSYCRYIDAGSALTWPGDFNVDHVHPTDAGYVKLGNAIYNGIVAYGSASVQGF